MKVFLKIKNYMIFKKIKKGILLIPKYKDKEKRIFEEDMRFEISENDFERIKNFNEFIEDDRILLMLYDTEPILIKIIIINFQKLKRKMLI
ncbi:MAG: hypothetical protein ACO2O6_08610 [Candidatus Hydrothermia bacterium]